MRTSRGIIAAAALAAVAACTSSAPVNAGTGCPAPIPVAHRGESSQAPEETGPAFVAAAKSGVKVIETDIRFTRSNVAVLFHDATVDRTTNGTGNVSNYYWSDLAKLDAGRWFSPAYTGTHPISFWQQLALLKPYSGVTVVPELKDYPTTAQLTNVSNAINTYSMASRTVVQSFYAADLTKFHAINPGVPLALTTSTTPADPVAALRAAGATYWLPNEDNITQAQVDAAHAAGVKVWPWTADTLADWDRLTTLGVDGILTNRAAQYAGWTMAKCGSA
jgi:glycerophosphoryl diester phosphodiesterase